MKQLFFFAFEGVISSGRLLAAVLLLLLSEQPALGQAFNQVPDEVEYQALAELYNSTYGQGWEHNTNWLKESSHADFATWYGVSVTNGDVSRIHLNANNLTGSLPASLGKLSRLTSLNITNNQINGPIPVSFVNLTRLYSLWLGFNNLTGTIPSYLGTFNNLLILDLAHNQFTGIIPETLGNLSSLRILYLYQNQLAGSIPESLGNLSQLAYLVLSFNRLSGSIPSSLGKLANLRHLMLEDNGLTGAIPESLGGLKKLTYLILNNNQLTGSIPESWNELPDLYYLSVNNNQLSGTIPAAFNNFSKLSFLYLHHNKFTLSPDFSSLVTRAEVNVANNHLGFASIEPYFDGPNQEPDTKFYYLNQTGQLPVNNRETGTDTIKFTKGGTLQMWVQDDAPHNVYRWQKLSSLSGWVDIPGATARNYVIPNALASAAGTYQCMVSNTWVTNMALVSHQVMVEGAGLSPPVRLKPNLPRQTNLPVVTGNNPPEAVPGAAGEMNYVRT